jgi:hypothetical protein
VTSRAVLWRHVKNSYPLLIAELVLTKKHSGWQDQAFWERRQIETFDTQEKAHRNDNLEDRKDVSDVTAPLQGRPDLSAVESPKSFLRMYAEFFHPLFCTAFRPPVLDPIQWVPRQFPPYLERTRNEANHSHPSAAEVKNNRPVPPRTVFLAFCLIN